MSSFQSRPGLLRLGSAGARLRPVKPPHSAIEAWPSTFPPSILHRVYPTDSGLASDGVKALAREGRKLAAKIGAKGTAVKDRSRAAGRRLRALTRSMRRRSGQAKEEVLELTKQTGQLLARSVKEARALAAEARRRARGRGAQAKLKAARKLEELADRCEKVVEQITKRLKGEKITDRLVSLWDRPADAPRADLRHA